MGAPNRLVGQRQIVFDAGGSWQQRMREVPELRDFGEIAVCVKNPRNSLSSFEFSYIERNKVPFYGSVGRTARRAAAKLITPLAT